MTAFRGEAEIFSAPIEPQTATAGAGGPRIPSRIGSGLFDRDSGGNNWDIPPSFRNAFRSSEPQQPPKKITDGDIIMAFHTPNPYEFASIMEPIAKKYGLNELGPMLPKNDPGVRRFMAEARERGLVRQYNAPVIGALRFWIHQARSYLPF